MNGASLRVCPLRFPWARKQASNWGCKTRISNSVGSHISKPCPTRAPSTKAHALVDVLTIGVCTLLCAGKSFNDMEDVGLAKEAWFKTFLASAMSWPRAVHDVLSLRL